MRWLLVAGSGDSVTCRCAGTLNTGAEKRTEGSASKQVATISGSREVKIHLHSGDEPCFAGRQLELWRTKVKSPFRRTSKGPVETIGIHLPGGFTSSSR